MVGLRFSGCLKRLFRDVVYHRFNGHPMFTAADGLPVNKIAFDAEWFPHGQEHKAENIGFGRENPFQKHKIRRTLERGGKGKAAPASSPASLQ